MDRPLRILIAEDSELFATVLTDLLAGQPDLEVLEVVDNGEDAVDRCVQLGPDLILMDIQMPRLDGLSATEQIMARRPTPILVVTSDPFRGGVDLSFKALSAGALDLMPKPALMHDEEDRRAEFLRKVRLLAQIPVIRHVRGKLNPSTHASLTTADKRKRRPKAKVNVPILAIVGSTGGPKALAKLLGEFDEDFGAAILVVQHITRGFTEHLARWLDANSAPQIQEATHGDMLRAGEVYIAPSDHHMEVVSGMRLKLTKGEPVSGHCPSGDVLLESLAAVAPRASVGVILSGMGSDGAQGMRALLKGGGQTIAQDRASSVVWGMPQAALEREAIQHVIELDQLAEFIVRRLRRIERRGDR